MTESKILAMMEAISGGCGPRPDPEQLATLLDLTHRLMVLRGGETQLALMDFTANSARTWEQLPVAELDAWMHGQTILVTGGTGHIGTLLMTRLVRRGARVVSLSRFPDRRPWGTVDGVTYLEGDVRDIAGMGAVFAMVRPNGVFHLAAQREPDRAEVEVYRTVTTNVMGMHYVLWCARRWSVEWVSCASTGKTMQAGDTNVYCSSKRICEWLIYMATTGKLAYDAVTADKPIPRIGGTRFTHIGGNSLIMARLRRWIAAGEPVILHGPHVMFYVQSGEEACDLLEVAALGATAGEPRLLAVSDPGVPVSLVDLALGVMAEMGTVVPIVFWHPHRGYKHGGYAQMSMTAGPMVNGIYEDWVTRESPVCPPFDDMQLVFRPREKLLTDWGALLHQCLLDEATACYKGELGRIAGSMQWRLLEASLHGADFRALERARGQALLVSADPDASVELRMIAEKILHEHGERMRWMGVVRRRMHEAASAQVRA